MYPDIRLLTPSGYPKYKITIRCSPNIYIYNILYKVEANEEQQKQNVRTEGKDNHFYSLRVKSRKL